MIASFPPSHRTDGKGDQSTDDECGRHGMAFRHGHQQFLSQLARGMAEGSVLLVDVRPGREFRHGHIAGALSVPVESLDRAMEGLPRDVEIVACCRGPWCSFAVEAVERLRDAGYRARRFEDGVDDWRLAGGAVA